MTKRTVDTVVFDLGGVLIDWDPRHLYRTIFTGPDAEADMERFLARVCTPEWNAEQDRGRTLAEATAILVEKHPDQAELIEAYYGRWDEMLGEPIDGSVRIAQALKRGGLRLIALSNWSAETFPRARRRMTFLDEFDGVLISGAVGLIKPDPAIFDLVAQRHQIEPSRAIFIDDSPKNVAAAAEAGFDAIAFESPDQLRHELVGRGLPVD
ncbi:MAG TPA: HAD family phosphatase [Acidothermaceae bacterium]